MELTLARCTNLKHLRLIGFHLFEDRFWTLMDLKWTADFLTRIVPPTVVSVSFVVEFMRNGYDHWAPALVALSGDNFRNLRRVIFELYNQNHPEEMRGTQVAENTRSYVRYLAKLWEIGRAHV